VRRPALIAIVALCGACGAIVGPDPSTSSAAMFDQVWKDVDLHYSFFDIKHVNWDSLGEVYRPRAIAAQDDGALAPVLSALLGNLHDQHILLDDASTAGSPYPNLFDPTITLSKYVRNVGGFSSGIDYGLVTSSVGYIRFQSFDGTGWLPQIDTTLAQLGAVTALIIDVRNNTGGLSENALGIAARFAERSTTVAYVRYRNGAQHSDFTASFAQIVTPAGSKHFSGNVYLLANRNTVSAAELFVLAMRAVGHTTVVGDTTGGVAGSPFARELQNGWTYQFPESMELTLDGRMFEDIGLPPDVPSHNTTVQINELVDTQLERAIALATGNP
jgi:peptidase S41-like protein/tricorn protease-like protein